jgi:RND family efflux transporter MFP subunit
MKWRAPLLAACVTVCLAAALAGAAAARGFDCVIEPYRVVEIRSPVEGLIEKIHVERGAVIRKGQPLVALESDVERSTMEAARFRAEMTGRIASARNRVEYATKKLERAHELHRQSFVSAQARDEAETEKRLAESELKDALENQELAKLEHRRAEDQLRLRSMRSPFNGYVVDRMLNPGDLAESGTGRKPILKIAQLDPLRVEVALPQEVYGRIKNGSVARVTPEGFDASYEARVTVVDRVIDAASGMFGVRLEIPNPKGELPGGLRCAVEFPGIKPAAAAGESPQAKPRQPQRSR